MLAPIDMGGGGSGVLGTLSQSSRAALLASCEPAGFNLLMGDSIPAGAGAVAITMVICGDYLEESATTASSAPLALVCNA